MSRLALFFFLTTVFLAGIGLFILYESSSYSAVLNIGDKYFYVKYQLIWITLGIIFCLILSRFNYRSFYGFALPILLVTLVLLFAVFVPGLGIKLKGAHRWIHLGLFVVQPSELLKISLTLYLAAWLSIKEKGRLVAFLLLFGICTFLVIAQPDMGTAAIIALTALIVYFLSGARIIEMSLLTVIIVLGSFLAIAVAPYRLARLTSFQNINSSDLSKTSYHVKQILISLGSGGIAGVGFGQSVQKYAYLPENTTDSIFAIFAEEAGFLGSLFLMSVFILYLFLGFAIAARAPDEFGRLLSAGITIFIGIQALVNIASQAVLVPLTGVPLPFISYGGSSMIINFISVGIILSIANSNKKIAARRRA